MKYIIVSVMSIVPVVAYGKDIAAWLERVTEYDAHRDPSWGPLLLRLDLWSS